MGALHTATIAGLPEGCEAELDEIVLAGLLARFGGSSRASRRRTWGPRVKLKQGVDLTQVKVKPRV